MLLVATPSIQTAVDDFGAMIAGGASSLTPVLSTDLGKIGLAGIVGFICIALVGATIGLILSKRRKGKRR